MKCSLDTPVFLKRPLVFPILLFSSVYLHCSFNKAFLSLPALLWNSAFSWVYRSLSPLPSTSLLSSAICKTSSDNHFAFLYFFFLVIVLVTVSCTVFQNSVHSSSGTLSTRSNLLNLFIKGIWFRSYLSGPVVFPTFFNLNLNIEIRAHDLSHSQLQVLFLLTLYRASTSSAAKNIINLYWPSHDVHV